MVYLLTTFGMNKKTEGQKMLNNIIIFLKKLKINVLIRGIGKKFYNIKRRYYCWTITNCATKVGKNLVVNKKSNVTNQTIIGDNAVINGLCISGDGNVIIGDQFICGPDCLMVTSTHNYDNSTAIPFDDTNIIKTIIIEDNVWLGNRVIILPGAKIGEGSIIQAGSVVIGDIPRCAIAGGHPAKVFKYRNIENYETLKKEKKFYVHSYIKTGN